MIPELIAWMGAGFGLLVRLALGQPERAWCHAHTHHVTEVERRTPAAKFGTADNGPYVNVFITADLVPHCRAVPAEIPRDFRASHIDV